MIGESELEQHWRQTLSRQLEPFKGRVTLVWLNELSLAEILERSSALPPNSVILYLIMALDGKGVVQSEELALSQLHAVANAPIFGMYDIQVGHGIVGGPLTPIVEQARNSADIARRILAGESPESIRTEPQTTSRPPYDARELQRWGISETRLPAGSVVQFRQPSMWDQYKGYIVGSATILGIQTALVAGLLVQRARRRRTEFALRESERRYRSTAEQNQDLAGRLISAQEEERTRIARDLHDDVSQQLAGVGIMLSGLKRKIGKPELQHRRRGNASRHYRPAHQRSRTSIRNLSHELHPSVLQHAGLVPTLARHCAEIERHHDVTVTFSAMDDLESLSPDVALCLFRVAQEALANAVRHSRARTILVQLEPTSEGVELRVIDDGIGFVPGERKGSGLGLRSMDERVRVVHGNIRVESSPMQGTKVLVWVPIELPQR